jgi:hypothetical protein
MTGFLYTNFSTQNVLNFRNSLLRTVPDADSVYLFIGRDTVWADENNPPAPNESVTTDIETRNNIIAIKKIAASNTAFVIPRYNWTANTVYSRYVTSDTSLFSKQFYVLTTDNNVYKCIQNGNGAPSLVRPTGTSTQQIETGDGYIWKFMFNLSSSMVVAFLNTSWIPVPYGTQKTSFQIAVENNAVYASGTPAGGHGKDAVTELGASRLMISQRFEGAEGISIPVNGNFRQFGIWCNPRHTNGDLLTGPAYLVDTSNTVVNKLSGYITMVENREVINRNTNQSELFQPVFKF